MSEFQLTRREDRPATIDERRKLVDALKPFAEAADFFEARRQSLTDEQLIVNHESVGWQCQLTLGDLKRAKLALSE